jgi:hypothetical protein
MQRYEIPEELVRIAIANPDTVSDTYGGRKIYQKNLNNYVLRVIVEEYKGVRRVITLYPAKMTRYAI